MKTILEIYIKLEFNDPEKEFIQIKEGAKLSPESIKYSKTHHVKFVRSPENETVDIMKKALEKMADSNLPFYQIIYSGSKSYMD